MLLLQPLLLIGMFMTGTTKSIFKSDIGKTMIAFTLWVALRAVQRVEGRQLHAVGLTTLQALVLLFFMAAFIRSVEDCYPRDVHGRAGHGRHRHSFGVGGGPAERNDYRLGLGTGGDTLADANFLALYLVVGTAVLMVLPPPGREGLFDLSFSC